MPDSRTAWKAFYRAAIFETDRRLASQKAAQAERALLARERKLFYAAGSLQGEEDLEDTLYALRALRTGLQPPCLLEGRYPRA